MATATYSVPNISCGHCVSRIEKGVSQIVGVKSVRADAGSKKVDVTFDAPATEDGIKAKLAEINYPAK